MIRARRMSSSLRRWRSRAVPRWVPIAYTVLTAGNFVLDGFVLNIVEALQLLSLLAVSCNLVRSRPQS